MSLRYAKALYVDCGGDPRVFDRMRLDEVLDWLTVHHARSPLDTNA